MKRIKPAKNQLWIYIALLVVVIVIMWWLGSRIAKSGANHDGEDGEYVDIAVMYSPASYYLYGDTVGGLDYDMLNAMARSRGMSIRLHPVVSLEEALDMLEKGDYHMIASLPITATTNKRFAMTEPVWTDRLVLVQPKDTTGKTTITSALQLAGDTVNVESDSPALTRIANLSAEIGDTVYARQHPDLSEEYLVMKVASGELRYAVVGEQTAMRLSKNFPNVDCSMPIGFAQLQGWVVGKNDSTLLNNVNAWLKEYKTTGEYNALIDLYLKK